MEISQPMTQITGAPARCEIVETSLAAIRGAPDRTPEAVRAPGYRVVRLAGRQFECIITTLWRARLQILRSIV